MEMISTDGAPAAIGPYSQAVKANGFLFCSGQLGMDPGKGELVVGVVAQAGQALSNMRAVLEAAGSGMNRVVKTTIYLADMGDFKAVNAAYADAFGEHKPARATVEVAYLPLDGLVEIDCIAECGE
jgi:2-iminobutanoate/2-iminopropanoate deaminase